MANISFSLLSLYNHIPSYIEVEDTEVVSALHYIRGMCHTCSAAAELEESMLETVTFANKFCETEEENKLGVCYSILFGPIEDVPAYISVPGYEILVNFRLTLANKKADSREETSLRNQMQ